MNKKKMQKIAVKIATQVIKVLYKDLIKKKKSKTTHPQPEGVTANEKH
jgi:hypothetical protein